jgi:protein SCO1/2
VHRLLGARVGRDIFMYSLTLDPDADTPEVLKAYADTFGVGPGWSFLTGERGDIERLRRKLGIVDPDPLVDADRGQHIGVVRFGIERPDRWAGCPALTTPKQIVRSILGMEQANAPTATG